MQRKIPNEVNIINRIINTRDSIKTDDVFVEMEGNNGMYILENMSFL